MNIFDYENKDVVIHCVNGETYTGNVKWCARAEDIDEDEDVLAIGEIGLLVSDIETIELMNKSA